MSEKIIKIIVAIMFVLLFCGLSIYAFSKGDETDGILWLILAQLYSTSTRPD